MKKTILQVVLMLSVVVLLGCQKDKEKINIDDFKINVSVYELLPEHVRNNRLNQVQASKITDKIYPSRTYVKLLSAYQYIDELFHALNIVLNHALDNHDINEDEVYSYNIYQYSASKDNNKLSLNIHDNNNNRNINLDIKDDGNGYKTISGKHEVLFDTFTFKYTNDVLSVHYYQSNNAKKADAMIERGANEVKTHVRYDDGEESYELYSIANVEALSILYYDQKIGDFYQNQYYEVIDKEGDPLYYALSQNGEYKATGWTLHALNYNRIEKAEEGKFIVDTNLFYNEPGKVNLYPITVDEENFYILGYLDFNASLLPIVSPREPFETNDYAMLNQLTKGTLDYYHEINR